MKTRIPVIIFATLLILNGCSSGKKAYEQGDYYKAVVTSVDRLRAKPSHKKAGQTLREAYPLAVNYYESRANNALASNSRTKWKTVVESYTLINNMYEQINRAPGALAIIPNPTSRYDELETARNNAAEEAYEQADIAFGKGTREGAREAVYLYREAQSFVPNYRDSNRRIEDALWAATLKVVVEPIPVAANNMQISAEFFENKITEYLHNQPVNEFVRFFTPEEASSLDLGVPDHVIELSFDEFVIGEVYFKETQVPVAKDSILVATYYTDAPAAGVSAAGTTTVAAGSTGSAASSSSNANATTVYKPTATADTKRATVGEQKKYDYSTTPKSTGGAGQTTPPVTTPPADTNPPAGSSGSDSGGTGNPPANSNTTPPATGSGNTTPPATDSGNTTNPPNSSGSDGTAPPPVEGDANTKVTICHKTGNGFKTITVNMNALQAHMNHGDIMGACADTPPETGDQNNSGNQGNNGNQGNDDKKNDNKGNNSSGNNDEKKEKKKGNNGLVSVSTAFGNHGGGSDHYILESEMTETNLSVMTDTVPPGKVENKVFTTAKATVYEFSKTVTSRGVLDFRVIEPASGKVITQEKLPGEYVWISEWATFNGDERALTPRQRELVKFREAAPPPPQDLFIQFTGPIYDQIITKIRDYYRNY